MNTKGRMSVMARVAWDEHKGNRGIWAWGYDRNVVKLQQYQQNLHPSLTLVSNTPEYKVLKVWEMARRHGNKENDHTESV